MSKKFVSTVLVSVLALTGAVFLLFPDNKVASSEVNETSRGPFVAGRIIDLDITVFRQLGTTSQGVFPASISW